MRIPTLGLALALLFGMIAVPSPTLAEDDEKKLEIFGDFRGRYEGFWFNEDPTGSDRKNRGRFRYRFRLNLKAEINDHFAAGARLTTGDSDNRSGNQTIGSPEDFGPADYDLRRAYVTFYPFKGGDLPGSRDGGWKFDFGRVPNPYVWKNGPDRMIWDSDIALSGVSTVFDVKASDAVKIFAATGYYPIDENSSGKDPFMFPFQGGLEIDASDALRFGARGTYYLYDELNNDFFDRAADFGNIPDGMAGDDMSSLSVVEGQGFVKFAGSEVWPVTAFGGVGINTSATESVSEPTAGKANSAYNFGIDIGSKKKAVRLGAVWVDMEANALVASYIDSDYLDGLTNRKGVIGYFQRQLLENTDFGGTIFFSEAKDKTLADDTTLKDSERWRLQLDLVVKF